MSASRIDSTRLPWHMRSEPMTEPRWTRRRRGLLDTARERSACFSLPRLAGMRMHAGTGVRSARARVPPAHHPSFQVPPFARRSFPTLPDAPENHVLCGLSSEALRYQRSPDFGLSCDRPLWASCMRSYAAGPPFKWPRMASCRILFSRSKCTVRPDLRVLLKVATSRRGLAYSVYSGTRCSAMTSRRDATAAVRARTARTNT